MNFLVDNNLLDLRGKLILYLCNKDREYFEENIKLYQNIDMDILNEHLSFIFRKKYMKEFILFGVPDGHTLFYKINENPITAYELIHKYIDEYEIIVNFLDLITSTFIKEEQIIDNSYFENWNMELLFSHKNSLFLYMNCYKYPKINKKLNMRPSDYKLLNFYDGNEDLDWSMFDSNLIYSDLIKNKIRNEYDISYFDCDFVKKYYNIFKNIYDLEPKPEKIETVFNIKDNTIVLSEISRNTELYRNINPEDYTFKYVSEKDEIIDPSNALILYNLIMENNFNIVYIYDYYGDLLVLQKFDCESILSNPELYKGIENRTDILSYINNSPSFQNIFFYLSLKDCIINYLLTLYLNCI